MSTFFAALIVLAAGCARTEAERVARRRWEAPCTIPPDEATHRVEYRQAMIRRRSTRPVVALP